MGEWNDTSIPLQIFYATPSLLAQSGFQNPTDPLNTAMQLAFDAPGKAPYDIFVSQPESAEAIGTIMAAIGVSNLYRIESVYPIRGRLVEGFDESLQDTLSVDIGAGNGHVVVGLRSAMPDLPGRLVAQDLPTVIRAASTSPPGVEMQAYDFFTEQPIKCTSSHGLPAITVCSLINDAFNRRTSVLHAALPPQLAG